MVVRALRDADRLARLHRRRLQPVDADRLLVADLVLEADVDIFAALQHLLGGLREARLVAVDRRNLEKARQERDQRKDDQQRRRAPVRGAGIVQHRGQAPRRAQRLPRVVGGRAHRSTDSEGLIPRTWPGQ